MVFCLLEVLVLACAVYPRTLIAITAKLACSLSADLQSQEVSMVLAWSEVEELS